jgi:hypothetical protein
MGDVYGERAASHRQETFLRPGRGDEFDEPERLGHRRVRAPGEVDAPRVEGAAIDAARPGEAGWREPAALPFMFARRESQVMGEPTRHARAVRVQQALGITEVQ